MQRWVGHWICHAQAFEGERASERGFLFKDILAPFLGSNKIIRSGFLLDNILRLFVHLELFKSVTNVQALLFIYK